MPVFRGSYRYMLLQTANKIYGFKEGILSTNGTMNWLWRLRIYFENDLKEKRLPRKFTFVILVWGNSDDLYLNKQDKFDACGRENKGRYIDGAKAFTLVSSYSRQACSFSENGRSHFLNWEWLSLTTGWDPEKAAQDPKIEVRDILSRDSPWYAYSLGIYFFCLKVLCFFER